MGTTVFGDEPAPRGSTQGRRGSNVNSLVQQAAEQAHRNAGLKGTPTLSRSTSRKQISRQASRGEAKQGQANSHDESHAKAGEQGHGHGNSHGHGHGHSHGDRCRRKRRAVPYIGYARATRVAQHAPEWGRPLAGW